MEEIRRSPVEVGKYLIIYRVSYIPGGDRRISEPPTVTSQWKCLPCKTVTCLDMPLYIFGCERFGWWPPGSFSIWATGNDELNLYFYIWCWGEGSIPNDIYIYIYIYMNIYIYYEGFQSHFLDDFTIVISLETLNPDTPVTTILPSSPGLLNHSFLFKQKPQVQTFFLSPFCKFPFSHAPFFLTAKFHALSTVFSAFLLFPLLVGHPKPQLVDRPSQVQGGKASYEWTDEDKVVASSTGEGGGNQGGTVDGRNPANQLIWEISHYLQGFSTIPGGAGFQPSTVSRGYGKPFLKTKMTGWKITIT